MKKMMVLVIVICGFALHGNSQVTPPVAISDTAQWQKPIKVYTKVDVAAAFPGGAAAWKTFLQQNLNGNIAKLNGAAPGSYTVMIKFMVDMDGSLKDFIAETHLGFGMENEAIRMLRQSPNWKVALIAGHKVRSYFRQPVTFVVP